MKKVLKVIGIILLLIIAVVLVGGLFTPKHYHFEKKVEIAAAKSKVWNNVSSLSAIIKWMPWMKMDPKMTSQITGDDGNVGAAYVWKSEQMGDGKMTITSLVPMDKTGLSLEFGPSKTPAKADLLLSGDETHTSVTWTFDTDYQYPMNFIFGTFMGKFLDKDFGKGLQDLKAISEAQ
ncbi:Polyketide cyclase / dehydrase and lipid transport [compost metagenome]